MILAALTFLTALSISAIAAYFSIAGLVAIFAAAPIPIAIMGCSLEAAKLVTASWVYRNWYVAPVLMKGYLCISIVILSLITSMGIFGYLSKATTEQASVAGSNTVKLSILDQQERVIKTRIEFLLSQNDKTTFASNRISKELQAAQKELKDVIEQKAPLMQEKNKIETELGPLKYITEFIYGKSDENLINKAVRWVIVLLIFVFDPLAILLTIAANISLKQASKPKPKPEDFTNFMQDAMPVSEEAVIHDPAPPKRKWSQELYNRRKPDLKVNISSDRIQPIPKDILEKVFSKKR